jgi:uncharacterized small protein (DUF1192 family)
MALPVALPLPLLLEIWHSHNILLRATFGSAANSILQRLPGTWHSMTTKHFGGDLDKAFLFPPPGDWSHPYGFPAQTVNCNMVPENTGQVDDKPECSASAGNNNDVVAASCIDDIEARILLLQNELDTLKSNFVHFSLDCRSSFKDELESFAFSFLSKFDESVVTRFTQMDTRIAALAKHFDELPAISQGIKLDSDAFAESYGSAPEPQGTVQSLGGSLARGVVAHLADQALPLGVHCDLCHSSLSCYCGVPAFLLCEHCAVHDGLGTKCHFGSDFAALEHDRTGSALDDEFCDGCGDLLESDDCIELEDESYKLLCSHCYYGFLEDGRI